jgi:hypothetical protein
MDRKSFLKLLLVIPFVTLLDVKKVFAKNDQVFVPPNPFKLPFINSSDNKVGEVFNLIALKDIESGYSINYGKNWCQNIIKLLGNDFYCMTYISPKEAKPIIHKNGSIERNYQIKGVIVGKNIDWWTPMKVLYPYKIGKTQRSLDVVVVKLDIDEDVIKNDLLHLTKLDQETIRNFLKNNKKEK